MARAGLMKRAANVNKDFVRPFPPSTLVLVFFIKMVELS